MRQQQVRIVVVRLRDTLPRMANGEPDVESWLDAIRDLPRDARNNVRGAVASITDPTARALGFELTDLLVALKMDAVTVMAGMAFFAVQRGVVKRSELDIEAAKLIDAVQRLSATDVLSFANSPLLSSERKSQAGNVRRMLMALIDDPRVAVIKLAERVVALREVKNADGQARDRMAREGLEFFAPLAGRLGIGQLKWAIEDLGFRYLYPNEYAKIAALLVGRREERERHVEAIRQDLEFRLSARGIDAEVHGRAKHIYSIWQKMRRKGIGFGSVHDVQALRVLVDDAEACYEVLGVVHTSWPHIRDEFDDYITNPKENGYRSIHTAVVGPTGRMLEVQIRTREMHEEAELGVCAHWAYKGQEEEGATKADWLRRVLDWHDEVNVAGADPTGAANRAGDGADRIFVTTPRGHVLDLRGGATPVDFAFRVHTDIGYRCRGARVDGEPVPLNVALRTGQSVDIVTGEEQSPRREWLNPSLGYVTTARARDKIQAWFRGQVAESNIRAGEALLLDSLGRLGLPDDLAHLATLAGYPSADELCLAVGVGDQLVIDLVRLLWTELPASPPDEPDAGTGTFHDFTVDAVDRNGLVLDIMSELADLELQVVSVEARAAKLGESASVRLSLLVDDYAALADAVDRIGRVAGVRDVRRAA